VITNFNNFLLEFRNDILTNPNFVKWFGKSKGVDESGNPKIYYHATRGDFDEFKRGEFGIHFGTKEQAHDRINYNINIDDNLLNTSIIPVYLKFENPIRLYDLSTWKPEDIEYNIKYEYNIYLSTLDNYWKEDSSSKIYDNIIIQLKKLGYDSVIYKNECEGNCEDDSVIVFDANQIKSAIGNTKFNLNSNNINENKL
jgi:hypothetical protein